MSILSVDFHTHILPGIDDGSPSVDESVKMICQEQAQGIKSILLTPHFQAQQMYPDVFLSKRQLSHSVLSKELEKEKDMPKLVLGAEVSFCRGMSRWMQLDQLTLGNSSYILIEMPLTEWSDGVYDELESIYREQGLTPILAHIERYLTPMNSREILNRLADLPVLLQANSTFLLKKRTRHTALKLIDEHRIHILSSDCHSSTWRPPCMAQAREILLTQSNENSLNFLTKMESAIMRNERTIFEYALP